MYVFADNEHPIIKIIIIIIIPVLSRHTVVKISNISVLQAEAKKKITYTSVASNNKPILSSNAGAQKKLVYKV